jgi:hypothetical protein
MTFNYLREHLSISDLISGLSRDLIFSDPCLASSQQEEEGKEIIINDTNYHVECTIKYLHSCARFILKNPSTNLLISKSPQKPTKPAANKKLTRIFCEIIKDSAFNKIWKKNHHKIVIENFAFLLLLNKKSLTDHDLTQKSSSVTQRDVFYHYTDVFESRITQEKIWFIEDLNTSEKRFKRVQEKTRTHWTRKVLLKENKGWWNGLFNLQTSYTGMNELYGEVWPCHASAIPCLGATCFRSCRASILKPWLSSRLFEYIAS